MFQSGLSGSSSGSKIKPIRIKNGAQQATKHPTIIATTLKLAWLLICNYLLILVSYFQRLLGIISVKSRYLIYSPINDHHGKYECCKQRYQTKWVEFTVHCSYYLRNLQLMVTKSVHLDIVSVYVLTHFLSSLTSLLFDITGTHEFKVVTIHITAIIFHAVLIVQMAKFQYQKIYNLI